MDTKLVFDLVARKIKKTKKKGKGKISVGAIVAIIVVVVVVVIIAAIIFLLLKRRKSKAARTEKVDAIPTGHHVEEGMPMVPPPGGNTSYQPLQPQGGPPQGYTDQGYPQQSYPMAGAPQSYPPQGGPQATGHTGAASDYYGK